MDPEWKNQNQSLAGSGQAPPASPGVNPPSAGNSVPPPTAPPSPPSAQTGPPSFSPPDTLSGQNLYEQYNPGAVASRRKIIVSIIVLLILVVPGGIGTYAFLNKKEPQKVDNQATATNPAIEPKAKTAEPSIENKEPAVPISWKTVDTKLGYTLKVPADWSGGNSVPTQSDFDIYKSTTITLGALSSSSGDAVTPSGKYISAGVESITTSNSEAEFEKAITNVDLVAQAFGLDKSQVKATLSKVNISGKQWLQVDGTVPGSFSRTLYLWVNDHTVFVSISNSNKDTLDKYSNDYLFPIAASAQVK